METKTISDMTTGELLELKAQLKEQVLADIVDNEVLRQYQAVVQELARRHTTELV